MIVRNLKDKEVLETTYRAHGGGIAQMVLDRRTLPVRCNDPPLSPRDTS